MKKELQELLKKFDKKPENLGYHGEYKIAEQINALFDKEENYMNDEVAERIAFDFHPGAEDRLNWGTYYGPKFILPSDIKGKVNIYPRISQINKDIINYWEKRAEEAENSMLKSRYADLVVDFKPRVLNQRASSNFYEIVIKSNIEICKNKLADNLSCIEKLQRALILAAQTQKIISDYLITEIINLDNSGETDKPGTWGFAVKWLVLEKNKKIKITDETKKELINKIKSRLKDFADNYNSLEHATILLSDFYFLENNEEELLKVLRNFEESYKKLYDTKDAMSKSHGYQKILEIYSKYDSVNQFNKIKKEIQRIIKEIAGLDLDWSKSLKEVKTEVQIPKDKIDKHLDFVFGKNRDEDLERVVEKIVLVNIPKKDNLQKQYKEISEKYVFQHLATQQIISNDGYIKAQLTTDFDVKNQKEESLRFIHEASNYVNYGLFALSIDLEEFRKNFSKDELFNFLLERNLFQKINPNVLREVIKKYYENDYLAFSHLAMPLIEKIVREFFKLTDGDWLNTNGFGGFEPFTLSNMLNSNLNHTVIITVFGESLGGNLLFYLRIVLTEKLGMELRNDIAHGKEMEKFFSYQISDLLFHIILIFSLVIRKDSSQP